MAAFIFLSERFLKKKVKRNMKKALAILLTAVMLLGVLTACGSKPAANDTAEDTKGADAAERDANLEKYCQGCLGRADRRAEGHGRG